MRLESWLSLLVAAGAFIGWMTALWIRVGRILQRIDDLIGDGRVLRSKVAQHETRLTRLEVVAEQK